MADDLRACSTCHLVTPEGSPPHVHFMDCITGLRSAILAQRKKADELGLTISSRLMAVLESLSLEPDVNRAVLENLGFKVKGPDGHVYDVPPERFVGVFSAIRHLYEKLGDWSPLEEARRDARQEKGRADILVWRIQYMRATFEQLAMKYSMSEEDRAAIVEAALARPDKQA